MLLKFIYYIQNSTFRISSISLDIVYLYFPSVLRYAYIKHNPVQNLIFYMHLRLRMTLSPNDKFCVMLPNIELEMKEAVSEGDFYRLYS